LTPGNPDIPRRAHPIADVVGRVDQRLSGSKSDGPPFDSDTVSTGFPSVDRVLGGGLRRRDLVVLGGDVGAGKSSLALAMALRVAERGESAAVMTGEMDEERMWERALAIEGRVKLDDIRRGRLTDESRASLGAAAVRLRERPLAWLPMAGDRLEDVATRLVSTGASLIVVDYLQLLPPAGATPRQLDEEMAGAVRRLKEVAAASGSAMLLLAQLPMHDPKRRDPRPSLDDFGALGAVKYHADVVLGIYREEMYHMQRGVEGATELMVVKNRHGTTGFVDLYFYREWMRFEDMIDADR
jgi:replicative DNA helicase